MNTQLMPFDKALELCTIAFSSKASTLDIVSMRLTAPFLCFSRSRSDSVVPAREVARVDQYPSCTDLRADRGRSAIHDLAYAELLRDVPCELYEAARLTDAMRGRSSRALPCQWCGRTLRDGIVQFAAGLQRVPAEPYTDRTGHQDSARGARRYGAEDIDYWTLSAPAAVGIMLPIAVFIMFVQRYIVRGVAFGAVKG